MRLLVVERSAPIQPKAGPRRVQKRCTPKGPDGDRSRARIREVRAHKVYTSILDADIPEWRNGRIGWADGQPCVGSLKSREVNEFQSLDCPRTFFVLRFLTSARFVNYGAQGLVPFPTSALRCELCDGGPLQALRIPPRIWWRKITFPSAATSPPWPVQRERGRKREFPPSCSPLAFARLQH